MHIPASAYLKVEGEEHKIEPEFNPCSTARFDGHKVDRIVLHEVVLDNKKDMEELIEFLNISKHSLSWKS